MSDPLIGVGLGGFTIRSLLGVGGMARVYRAEQLSLGREIALKVLPRNPAEGDELLLRFQREKDVLKRLQHPHILPVYDFGADDNYLWIAMLLVEGSRHLQGPLTLDYANRVLSQLGGALSYAHRNGIIHRDLKPANVLVADGPHLYLSDFGIAKVMEGSKLTASDSVVGTPSYIAPEQLMNRPIDARCDIYSLGIMMYELITGRLPFEGPMYSVMQAQLTQAPPPPSQFAPELTPQLERVLLKALEKDPDARYSSAQEMADAFEASLHGRRQEAATILGKGSPLLIERVEELAQAAPTRPVEEKPAVPVAVPPRAFKRRLRPVHLVGMLIASGAAVAAHQMAPQFNKIQPELGVAFTLRPSNEDSAYRVALQQVNGNRIVFGYGGAPHFWKGGMIYDKDQHIVTQALDFAHPNREASEYSVTPKKPYQDYWGVVQPGAQEMLFHSDRPKGQGDFRLYRLQLDAAGKPKGPAVPWVKSDGLQQWARFSPQGDRVAYSGTSTGTTVRAIFVANFRDPKPRQITTPKLVYEDRCPDWSPQGDRVVFERTYTNGKSELVVSDFDKGIETVVPLPAGLNPHHPSWQPAPYLLFSGSGGVYACTPEGGRLTRIAEATGAGCDMMYPVWVPKSKP